jgi:hypothetical protein
VNVRADPGFDGCPPYSNPRARPVTRPPVLALVAAALLRFATAFIFLARNTPTVLFTEEEAELPVEIRRK